MTQGQKVSSPLDRWPVYVILLEAILGVSAIIYATRWPPRAPCHIISDEHADYGGNKQRNEAKPGDLIKPDSGASTVHFSLSDFLNISTRGLCGEF